ncbi:MAG: GNAT family N-acetyltransferase [Actinomycetota bacterium]
MDIELRNPTPETIEDFWATLEGGFGWVNQEEPEGRKERWLKTVDLGRLWAAYDEDRVVATSGNISFELTVPGGQIPAGGVTMISVLPSHRRRGILRRVMTHLLDESYDKGEPISILWASEEAIYPKFGYGIASLHSWFEIERERAVFRGRPAVEGRVLLLDHDDAMKVIPTIYDEVRARTPGMFARSEAWWETNTLYDAPHRRSEAGLLYRAVWEHDGRPEAYALYRMKSDWVQGSAAGKVEAFEVMATTPLARREMWRFVFGLDLVSRVDAPFGPADNPLLLMLEQPRRLHLKLQDSLWLRIVDVKDALEARSYAADGTLVLEVTDDMYERNSGRWRLDASGGSAVVTRTEEEPDLVLDIVDLGSIYLGGFTFSHLARAGRVAEARAGAIARADGLFMTNVAPWCPEIF